MQCTEATLGTHLYQQQRLYPEQMVHSNLLQHTSLDKLAIYCDIKLLSYRTHNDMEDATGCRVLFPP